jgi:hypothetical protein
MVLLGSTLAFIIFAGQAILILAGNLSPLVIFLTGGLVSFAQERHQLGGAELFR